MADVTTDDLKRYQAFVGALARSLGALDVDGETVLWHYTNGNGLLGILRSRSLYSTHVSCLNDSTEVLYASKLFRDALEVEKGKYLSPSPERTFIEEAIVFFGKALKPRITCEYHTS